MISRSLFTHFSPSFTDYSSLNISSHRFTRSGECCVGSIKEGLWGRDGKRKNGLWMGGMDIGRGGRDRE